MRFSPESLIEAFKGKKVLIIGDVMVDSYIYGSVSRISPEAPVPIMNVKSKENRLGGAANVALNIKALGATPVLCSIVGDDDPADEYLRLMELEGMNSAGIIRSQSRQTTLKNRLISGSHHLIRIDEENDKALSAIDQKALESHIKELMDDVEVVIFEDYDKGCLNKHVIEFTVDLANKKGIPSAVDPKHKNFHFYRNSTLFKPNLKELQQGLMFKFSVDDEHELKKAVDRLIGEMGISNVLLTLSDKGIYFQDQTHHGVFPAHLRNISDVSGAGDTVISIAALCITLGIPLAMIAELANLAGGIVCEYPGVVPIIMEDLLKEIGKNEILQEFFE